MKKIIIITLLLFISSLFAEDYVIRVSDFFSEIKTENVNLKDILISEICPVNENTCKIVYLDTESDVIITEYLQKLKDFHYAIKKFDSDSKEFYFLKYQGQISQFDYNCIKIYIREIKSTKPVKSR